MGSLPASFTCSPAELPGTLGPGSDLTCRTSRPLLGDRLAPLRPCSPVPPKEASLCTVPPGPPAVSGGGALRAPLSLWFTQLFPHLPQRGNGAVGNVCWHKGANSETSNSPLQPGRGGLPPEAPESGTPVWVVLQGSFGVKKNPRALFWILPRVLFLWC